VLLFRRAGWGPAEYQVWSDRLLDEGRAFVTPTSWNGEVVLRLCIINPLTSFDDIRMIVDSLG
ncbi:MAG: aspartate aminotransferase family protein, partial [Ilumatobacteraceae bacterium]